MRFSGQSLWLTHLCPQCLEWPGIKQAPDKDLDWNLFLFLTSVHIHIFPVFFLFDVYLFIETERKRERASMSGGRAERDRDRENSKQAPHCQRRAWHGPSIHKPNSEIISWAKIKSRTPNWATQVPHFLSFFSELGISLRTMPFLGSINFQKDQVLDLHTIPID